MALSETVPKVFADHNRHPYFDVFEALHHQIDLLPSIIQAVFLSHGFRHDGTHHPSILS